MVTPDCITQSRTTRYKEHNHVSRSQEAKALNCPWPGSTDSARVRPASNETICSRFLGPCVMENRVIKMGSDYNSDLHTGRKNRLTANASRLRVRVTQTAFTYSSTGL